MAIDKKTWNEIRAKYELGDQSVNAIAKQYDINEATIRVKIKKDGWTQKLRTQMLELQDKVEEITNEITNSEKFVIIEEKLKQIIDIPRLQLEAQNTQRGLIGIVKKATQHAHNLLNNNPDGVYVKSTGQSGTTYGRTTEVLKDIAPIAGVLNSILGVNKTTEVNNNTQINSEASSIQFYIPQNGRDKNND